MWLIVRRWVRGEKDKLLVVIYVILKPDALTSPDELVAFGKQHLAAYKTPKTVYIAKDFPRTKNGKSCVKILAPILRLQNHQDSNPLNDNY